MNYTITEADRLAIPAALREQARFLGYGDSDRTKPYARFFEERTARVQDHVFEAIALGERPSEYAYTVSEAAARMSAPGYERMETGFALRPDGQFMVAIHTLMPRVSAEMWDWWFSWHGHESARYKLWHPEAHMLAPYADDRRGRGLPWAEQYIGNVSYAVEYVGGTAGDLCIRFTDPAALGFTAQPGTIVIAGRIGPATAPVAVGWGIHQVRPIEGGCEMRSRFFFNDVQVLDLPSHSIAGAGSRLLSGPIGKIAAPVVKKAVRTSVDDFGLPLLVHCAQEMNHLARFLPELFAEFKDLP